MAIIFALELGHIAHAAGLVPKMEPEIYYAYSGAEFNDQFGPSDVAKLARKRAAARLERKARNRARYERRHGIWCRNVYSAQAYEGLTGTRPRAIILDDPHAEDLSAEQRTAVLKWYEDRAPR